MPEQFDVVIIGAGTGGETVAYRTQAGGKRVAIIERELIGGECAYWACIPSKGLIRPSEIIWQAEHTAGMGKPAIDWHQIAAYRDFLVREFDDQRQVKDFDAHDITFIRGEGRIESAGTVTVGDRLLRTEHIVIATGSQPVIPPIPGLREAGYWTNREATSARAVPASLIIVGGSAQAIELAHMFQTYGSQVTLIHRGERLLTREQPDLGDAVAAHLRETGVDVRLGTEPVQVEKLPGGERVVTLKDGSRVTAQELLLATGRSPRTEGIGRERINVQVNPRGVAVNVLCAVAPNVWAVGDVTGVGLFTHIAGYQARVVADNILGKTRRADYRAVPRVVFTAPEIAATGLSSEQAKAQGLAVATSVVDLYEETARPVTYGKDIPARLGLIADRERRVLVGAWAYGPEAGEWIHVAVLAIRAEVPLDILSDVIEQFPTFSEGYVYAVEKLNL